eukprot:9480844-Pyramimonas_sp.AAC.1
MVDGGGWDVSEGRGWRVQGAGCRAVEAWGWRAEGRGWDGDLGQMVEQNEEAVHRRDVVPRVQ